MFDDGVQDAEIHLDGYILFRQDRPERRGGGIVMYVESAFNPTFRAPPAEAQTTTYLRVINLLLESEHIQVHFLVHIVRQSRGVGQCKL